MKWTLAACLAVNVYLLGAMLWFAAIAYPQFGAVDRAAFPPIYAAFTARIAFTVVPWEFVAFLATLPLYFARPVAVPVWCVHALVALGVAYFAITFAWHLPAHRPLAAGDNSGLAVLLTSQWVRTGVQAVRAGVLIWAGTRG